MESRVDEGKKRKKKRIVCPSCESPVIYRSEDTKLAWGTCKVCGTKLTLEIGKNIQAGWVKVGCWEPPKEKLNEEVIDYIKSKGARPFISGEWLSKQEKLGKTFLMLKPQVDALIEDYFEREVKELC